MRSLSLTNSRNWQTAVQAILTIWFVAIAIRFAGVVTKALASPFNDGADSFWAIGWMTFSVLLVLAFAVVRLAPRRMLGFLFAATVVAVLSLSGSWVSALLASWLIVLCAMIGSVVLRRVGQTEYSVDEYLACGAPIGMGIISLAILTLGLLGYLTVPIIWALVLSSSIASAACCYRDRAIRREIIAVIRAESGSADEHIVLFIMGAILILNLLWAVAPEVQYDALNYHLVVPARYLQSGRIIDLPFFHAYFARLVELFLVTCLAVGGPGTAKMFVFMTSIVATLAVYALGRRAFDEGIGLWAAALFTTTPLVGWLSGTVYIDNVLALLVTASFIAIVRWEDSRSGRCLYIAALLCGVAIGAKITAAFAYVIICPVMLLQIFAERLELEQKLRTIAIAVFLSCVTAFPTYIVTYMFTGNPVFPFLNAFFHSPKWPPDNTMMNAFDYGLPMNLASLVRFPFRLSVDTVRFGEAHPRGSVGVALLLAFPFAVCLIPRARPAVRLLICAAAGYLLLLFYTMQYARYYVLILPLVAVLGVATVRQLTPLANRWASTALLTLCLVQPLIQSLQFWNIYERFPVAIALGREDKQSFLRRALPGYSATMYLNTMAKQDDKILGVGTENLRFYLHAELKTWALTLEDDPIQHIARMQPDHNLADVIKKAGITYLFTTRVAAQNPSQEFPYLQHPFLSTHTVLVYEDAYSLVYRVL